MTVLIPISAFLGHANPEGLEECSELAGSSRLGWAASELALVPAISNPSRNLKSLCRAGLGEVRIWVTLTIDWVVVRARIKSGLP